MVGLLFLPGRVRLARPSRHGWHRARVKTTGSTSTRYAGTVEGFLAFLAANGRKADMPISTITPTDCGRNRAPDRSPVDLL